MIIVGAIVGVLLGVLTKKGKVEATLGTLTSVLTITGASFYLSLAYLANALIHPKIMLLWSYALWIIGFYSLGIVGLIAFYIAFYITTNFDGGKWKRRLKQKTSAAKKKLLAKVRELAPAPKPAATPA